MNILVYGAGGQLGRMVAAALQARGASLTLSSRRPDRLTPGPDARVHDAAEPLPQDLSVVINCASLSWEQTESLVRAGLEVGAHYLDTSGEQWLIGELLERFEEAERCVVPAVGFDYAVGDCLARLAASEFDRCSEVVVAYALEGGQAALHSLEFATHSARGPEVVYREGSWRKVPFELDLERFDFPPPSGRRRMGRYGAGEVMTVPRHTRVSRVRTLITASSLVPHPALLPLFPLLRPLAGLILKTRLRTWIGWLGRRLAGSSGPPSQGDGPAFQVVAEAVCPSGRRRRCVAKGPDCHRTTAEAVALGGLWLARGEVGGRGAQPPAVAFPPERFLNALAPGLTWSME